MGQSLSMELESNATAGKTLNLQVLEYFSEVGKLYFERTGEQSTTLIELEAWQLLGCPETPVHHNFDDTGVCCDCGEEKAEGTTKWCPWNPSH